jgi:hypothetical protein
VEQARIGRDLSYLSIMKEQLDKGMDETPRTREERGTQELTAYFQLRASSFEANEMTRDFEMISRCLGSSAATGLESCIRLLASKISQLTCQKQQTSDAAKSPNSKLQSTKPLYTKAARRGRGHGPGVRLVVHPQTGCKPKRGWEERNLDFGRMHGPGSTRGSSVIGVFKLMVGELTIRHAGCLCILFRRMSIREALLVEVNLQKRRRKHYSNWSYSKT